MKIRFTIEATINSDDIEEFLAMLLAFDRKHDCIIGMSINNCDMTTDEATQMLQRLGMPDIYVGRKQ
jgi:hypothetical protein